MKARWQDWLLLVLGAWLVFAPFWMPSYASPVSTAAWNSYLFGGLVGVFAITALIGGQRWAEWIELLCGVWLMLSPFMLGFFGYATPAALNTLIVGLLVAADAIALLARRPPVERFS